MEPCSWLCLGCDGHAWSSARVQEVLLLWDLEKKDGTNPDFFHLL